MYDYSTAERTSFDLIPAKTVAPVRIALQSGDAGTPENAFAVTRTGLHQLVMECTITEGEFAKRKIFNRLTTGAQPGTQLTEGQEKGIAIGKAQIRAILEAARGFAPTDESPEAVAARKMQSIHELDGLEVWVEIGIEKGKDGYEDKNKIMKILPAKPGDGGRAAAPATRPAAAPRARGW